MGFFDQFLNDEQKERRKRIFEPYKPTKKPSYKTGKRTDGNRVAAREGFGFEFDPWSYTTKREKDKLDEQQGVGLGKYNTGNPNDLTKSQLKALKEDKKKAFEEDEDLRSFIKESERKTIVERYRQDPKSVSSGEIAYALGYTPDTPENMLKPAKSFISGLFDDRNHDYYKYKIDKNTEDTFNKRTTINELKENDHYSLEQDPKRIKKTFPNDYFTQTDIERMKPEDIEKLKNTNSENVWVRWNDQYQRMSKDEAVEVAESDLKQFAYNTKNKSAWENIGDRSVHTGKRLLDAIGVVGQGVQGAEKAFRDETGIEMGKILKPLAGQQSDQIREYKDLQREKKRLEGTIREQDQDPNENMFAIYDDGLDQPTLQEEAAEKRQQRLEEINQRLAELDRTRDSWEKSNLGWKDSWEEIKEIGNEESFMGTERKVIGALPEMLGGAWDGASKSVSGYYTKFPEEKHMFAKSLAEQTWDPNATSTKAWGFFGDVASELSLAPAGRKIITKGGKTLTDKGADEFIEKTLKEKMGVNNLNEATPQAEAVRKIVGQYKANGQITEQQIDDIFNQQLDEAMANEIGPTIKKREMAEQLERDLEDRITNFKDSDIPKQTGNWQDAIMKQNQRLNAASDEKREAEELFNAFSNDPLSKNDENFLIGNFMRADKRENQLADTLNKYLKNDKKSRINNIVGATQQAMKQDERAYNQLLKKRENAGQASHNLRNKEINEMAAFRNQYNQDNGTWQNFLKENALGPMEKRTLFGFNSLHDKAQNLGSKIGNLPGFRNFHDTFNKTFDVDQSVVEKRYDLVGQSNYKKAIAKEEIDGLTRGKSEQELKELAYHLVRPDEFKKPSSFTDEDIAKLKAIRDRSFDRDSEFADIEFIQDYLPGVYKNDEKALEKIFGPKDIEAKKRYLNSHKKRKYRDFIDAKQQNPDLKPEENAGKLLLSRESNSIDFEAKERMRKWYEDMQKVNPNMFNARTRKYIEDFINPQLNKQTDNNLLKLLGKGVKGYQDYWKVGTMNTVPETGMRNLYGGFINNALDGVNPMHYLRALGAKRNGLTTKDGETLSPEQYREYAARAGASDGQIAHDVMETATNEGQFGKTKYFTKPSESKFFTKPSYLKFWDKDKFIGFEPGKMINSKVEELLRNARVVKAADDYGTKGNAVQKAATDVRKTQFDYNPQNALTPSEQFLRNYIAPFYTFQKNNLPYQAKKILENPRGMNMWANHLPNAFNAHDPNNEDLKPEYRKNDLYLGQADKDVGLYAPMNFNSTGDFMDWFNPGKKASSMLGPHIKGAVNSGLNALDQEKSLGGMNIHGNSSSILGQTMSEKAPQLVKDALQIEQSDNGYWTQDAGVKHVMNNIFPQSYNIQNVIREYENSDAGNGAGRTLDTLTSKKALDMLTGLVPNEVDYVKQKHYKTDYENRETNREYNELKMAGDIDTESVDKPLEIPDYDIERAWRQNSQLERNVQDQLQSFNSSFDDNWTQMARKSIKSGVNVVENPEGYGNKFYYDPFGNLIHWEAPYVSKSEGGQYYQKYKFPNMVKEGREASKQDWKQILNFHNQDMNLEEFKKYSKKYGGQ